MENVNTIQFIADFFMIAVAWAMIFFSPLASTKLTGHGLMKLLTSVALGALAISSVIAMSTPERTHWDTLKLMCIVFFILNYSFHRDIKSFWMWIIWGVLSISLPAILIGQHYHSFPGSVFILSAALFLGVITYSMILGHWYLVVPKLSEAPLKRAAMVTWALLLMKIIWSSISLWNNWEFFEEQTTLGAGYAFNWTLLLMRIAFGYIVIAGMSIFNWKLLKLRSIQSSTGVLYAMTFFVFIGELVSIYLFKNYGLYI